LAIREGFDDFWQGSVLNHLRKPSRSIKER
jgi:hypothetical protein